MNDTARTKFNDHMREAERHIALINMDITDDHVAYALDFLHIALAQLATILDEPPVVAQPEAPYVPDWARPGIIQPMDKRMLPDWNDLTPEEQTALTEDADNQQIAMFARDYPRTFQAIERRDDY